MARAKVEKFDGELVGLAAFAKALAHPARIEILRHLGRMGEQPCMAIVEHLPLSQPACSRHINELLRVGLLKSRCVRTQILFQLNHQALKGFCGMMNQTLHPPRSEANPRGSSRSRAS